MSCTRLRLKIWWAANCLNPGLIQSLEETFLSGLRAWDELGGMASSLSSKVILLQPISF